MLCLKGVNLRSSVMRHYKMIFTRDNAGVEIGIFNKKSLFNQLSSDLNPTLMIESQKIIPFCLSVLDHDNLAIALKEGK
jgi:hypothetical protein